MPALNRTKSVHYHCKRGSASLARGVMVKMQGSLPHGCIQEKEVLCLGTLATDLGAKLLERNSYNKTSSHARARQICKPILFECVPRSGKDHNFVIIGVPKESYPGESRVALVPAVLPNLLKAGFEVVIETEAGSEAGYPDRFYSEKGAKVLPDRAAVFGSADIVVQVLCYGSNDITGKADLPLMRRGQALIGFLRPFGSVEVVQQIADTLPRLFPMLTTAAGTITPARVLVVGTGVAGLQAIATGRRLGAVVSAYDLRPAAKEQVQSLGGRFVELPIEAKDAQDAGGYAKAQDEDFYRRQRELLGKVVAENDVVITAAVVPGKKSPVLVTREMVAGMAPGSVIVDLAAERGGNCELTQADQVIAVNGVTIVGTINLASTVPYHASQMYAKNITAFLQYMVKDGKLVLNLDDEIIQSTLVTHGGEVVNSRVREFFSLPPLVAEQKET